MGLQILGWLLRWFSMVGVCGGHPFLVLRLSEKGWLHDGHQVLDLIVESGKVLHMFL